MIYLFREIEQSIRSKGKEKRKGKIVVERKRENPSSSILQRGFPLENTFHEERLHPGYPTIRHVRLDDRGGPGGAVSTEAGPRAHARWIMECSNTHFLVLETPTPTHTDGPAAWWINAVHNPLEIAPTNIQSRLRAAPRSIIIPREIR